jgi:hypothetical protein
VPVAVPRPRVGRATHRVPRTSCSAPSLSFIQLHMSLTMTSTVRHPSSPRDGTNARRLEKPPVVRDSSHVDVRLSPSIITCIVGISHSVVALTRQPGHHSCELCPEHFRAWARRVSAHNSSSLARESDQLLLNLGPGLQVQTIAPSVRTVPFLSSGSRCVHCAWQTFLDLMLLQVLTIGCLRHTYGQARFQAFVRVCPFPTAHYAKDTLRQALSSTSGTNSCKPMSADVSSLL